MNTGYHSNAPVKVFSKTELRQNRAIKTLLPSLPDTVTLQKMTPPAPDDFYTANCICDETGNFIAEMPAGNSNRLLDLIGYYYTGHRAGLFSYCRRQTWTGKPTRRQKYEHRLSEQFANAEAVPLF